MRRFSIAILTVLATLHALAPASSAAEDGFDHSHATWTRILQRHVRGDAFDYAALAKEREELDQYLAQLQAVSREELASWTREERYAFWINTYNAHVVSLVSTKYPTSSIRNLGTVFSKVWDREFIEMNSLHPKKKDERLSLDDIEHKILRPRFEDARVHAAINCASESCPPLRNEAFVADRLEGQLDDQVRRWLADDSYNRFDRTATKVEISRLFDWFGKDFARDAGSVQAWIARYAPEPHGDWVGAEKKLKISFNDYSWDLNDVERE